MSLTLLTVIFHEMEKLWRKAFSLSGYNFQGKFWLLIFKTGLASLLFRMWFWSIGSGRQRKTFYKNFWSKNIRHMWLLNYWILPCWRSYEVNSSILCAFAKAFFFFFVFTSHTKKINQTIFYFVTYIEMKHSFL